MKLETVEFSELAENGYAVVTIDAVYCLPLNYLTTHFKSYSEELMLYTAYCMLAALRAEYPDKVLVAEL